MWSDVRDRTLVQGPPPLPGLVFGQPPVANTPPPGLGIGHDHVPTQARRQALLALPPPLGRDKGTLSGAHQQGP